MRHQTLSRERERVTAKRSGEGAQSPQRTGSRLFKKCRWTQVRRRTAHTQIDPDEKSSVFIVFRSFPPASGSVWLGSRYALVADASESSCEAIYDPIKTVAVCGEMLLWRCRDPQ